MTPAFELDHLFICAPAEAPDAERLIDFGLTEGSPNHHTGQGTANRRFFFRNAMLELLWVRDEREARGPEVTRLRLWERWRWRETGASPFGACLRPGPGHTAAHPFETWEYRPAYLPPDASIRMAVTSDVIEEPLLFYVPSVRRPDQEPPSRRQPLDHPAGVREIRAVRVIVPRLGRPSAALAAVEALGVATFAPGSDPVMELSFDGAPSGRSADFRPHLPLIVYR